MKFFYLSTVANSQGDFVIHERNCMHKPNLMDLVYLGPFNGGREALREALKENTKSAMCEHCCRSVFSPSFKVNEIS